MEDKQQTNDDKNLKDLFKGFHPDISSGKDFVSNLERSLNAVDLVKEHTHSLRHKNYIALAIAFLAGIIVGIGLSLLFPLIVEWTLTFFISSPTTENTTLPFDWSDWKILGWLLIAATCIFTAKNAYDITLYKLSMTEAKQRA